MYIAGFVIPVPEEKTEAYRRWGENGDPRVMSAFTGWADSPRNCSHCGTSLAFA